MTQINDNMPRRKGKHLTRDERIEIKVLKEKEDSNRAIARAIGCHRQTVKNELDRRSVSQVKAQKQNGKTYRYTHTVYFPDAGQRQYEANRLHCGCMPKWVDIHRLHGMGG
ncbi:Helix-turn-helix domain-containing protein [Lacicoccus qingdaonensis]|uniref:Helix-turn-helix domain-containing protein n=2 Tax=Lacicoccus qingdaonensis TaxID=576118 RepID=A0A1G9FVT1_9BACL|nr:Helix-turn-helix domain-containing protein [Salinicoccus qingdaonensis]